MKKSRSVNLYSSYLPFLIVAITILSVFVLANQLGRNQDIRTRADTVSTYSIYDENLANDWTSDASWNGIVSFTSTTDDPFSGTYFLIFSPNQPWAGLYLKTTKQINSSPYSLVQLAVKATENNQRLGLILYDENNQALQSAVNIATYGGNPIKDEWSLYRIPLRELNGVNKNITGISLQDLQGKIQSPFYVDSIELVSE